jgi:DNA-binding phage protein
MTDTTTTPEQRKAGMLDLLATNAEVTRILHATTDARTWSYIRQARAAGVPDHLIAKASGVSRAQIYRRLGNRSGSAVDTPTPTA